MSDNRRRRHPGDPVRESPVRKDERDWKANDPHGSGDVEEVVNNIKDTVINFSKSTALAHRIYHGITDISVSQARKQFEKGDHIATIRSVYTHHGIYDGQGGVYEYNDCVVRHTSLGRFADGDDLYRVEEDTVYTPGQIIYRAQSRLGETDYNILYNNCENFATWCRLGAPIKTRRKRTQHKS